jgi:hexosaminidase
MKTTLIAFFMLLSSVAASPLPLIPMPLEVTQKEGSFTLEADASITYTCPESAATAGLLAERLRTATGYAIPVREGSGGTIHLSHMGDESLGDEGYVLEVDQSVSIKALQPAGIFYGTQTLLQLLPPEVFSRVCVDTDWTIPAVRIRDLPRFGWRGLHLDVSRHFMPKEDVLKFIDVMASLKLNVFHWHLTDDQGWRIEIRKYPRLTEIGAWRAGTLVGHNRDNRENPQYDGIPHGGFYTQADIREVVAYAAERHITIVPEIDMPGHMQAAIAAYPELGCTDEAVAVATRWGVSHYILNPEESTVQFCKDVLSEVMELFPSTFIHIGGDEARKNQWEASERIRALLAERELDDMHAMQSWFIKQIDDFLVANGRRLIGWDEIAEGGLAKNATVMWWRGKKATGRDIALGAIRDGHDVVVASNSHLYFDYYQSPDRENEPLAIGGNLPLEKVYAFEPLIEELTQEESDHILGAQGQLWREYLPTTASVEYMAFPRTLALAELVWLPEEQKDYASFLKRIKIQERRLDATGVHYRKHGETVVDE